LKKRREITLLAAATGAIYRKKPKPGGRKNLGEYYVLNQKCGGKRLKTPQSARGLRREKEDEGKGTFWTGRSGGWGGKTESHVHKWSTT